MIGEANELEYLRHLEMELEKSKALEKKILKMENDCLQKGEDSVENEFINIIYECFLYQHVSIPTFQNAQYVTKNTLDLIFTKNNERVYQLESNPVLGNINHGHLVLTCKFNLDTIAMENYPKYKFDYSKCDYPQISLSIDKIDWNHLFDGLSVQFMYDLFIEKISQPCNAFIPIIDVNSRKKIKNNPWFTDEVSLLVRSKQNLRNENLSSNWKDLNKVMTYKNICKTVKIESFKARCNYENDLVEKSKINPKLLYKYVNSQKTIKQIIKALRDQTGCVTNDQNEIVEILNKQKFQINILKHVDINKTYGVDSIHPLILKNCAVSVALPLTLIFIESFVKSELPTQWRAANITPLFKKEDKLEAANYRPVSLTSITCKIMEGKSCTTNLLEALDYISSNLSIGISVDEALLDFVKAFDSVAHKRLLIRLSSYGISGLLLQWIEAFLKNRTHRVIRGDVVSSWRKVFSGVPQSSSELYADDTKILSKVINVENSLQKDLDSAEEWSKKWLLGFNSSKCVIMHYDSECERDLGVYFSTNLKWKKQIISSTSKANSMMGMLKMTFSRIDAKLVKSLYKVFIRPLIEFAVPVWSPYFKGDISLLEKVQHRMTRLVPSLRKINYEKRLEILDISTLKTRRERGDLIQVFKLLNRFEEIDLINEPKLKIDSITRGHNLKYEREIVNYLLRHHFLLNRTANLWNALPEIVVTSKTVNQFKNNLDEYNAKTKKF
ncbi:uncharacterized protein LOC105847050 [Hydra vulgaris]|uniref:uncharacterized protein LOC105847050 n=1 Tax=Hydra vulgaris TaxID=6087 RepID=UPI0032EA6478